MQVIAGIDGRRPDLPLVNHRLQVVLQQIGDDFPFYKRTNPDLWFGN